MPYKEPGPYDPHRALRRALEVLRDQEGVDALALDKRNGSAKSAAAFFGVAPSTFGNWRSRGLAADNVPKIAFRLDVDPAYLLGLTDEQGRYDPEQQKQKASETTSRVEALETEIVEIKALIAELASARRARP